jgi:hypothetical protein
MPPTTTTDKPKSSGANVVVPHVDGGKEMCLSPGAVVEESSAVVEESRAVVESKDPDAGEGALRMSAIDALCDYVTWIYGARIHQGGMIGDMVIGRPMFHQAEKPHEEQAKLLVDYWMMKKRGGVNPHERIAECLETSCQDNDLVFPPQITQLWFERLWSLGGQSRYDFARIATLDILFGGHADRNTTIPEKH